VKYYVVIDLEMCRIALEDYPNDKNDKKIKSDKIDKNDKKFSRRGTEIIQFGAVLLDEKYKILDGFNRYVKPRLGELDEFITELTGITEDKLKDASGLEEVLEDFAAWIPDGEISMVSWSKNDKRQISLEMKKKEIENPKIKECLRHWIDCQKIFAEKVGTIRCYSLSDAVASCGIELVGQEHDGYYDAYNTGLLFGKLMLSPDIELDLSKLKSNEEVTEPLATSLGGLLSGLGLWGE